MNLHDRVREFAARHALWSPATRIVVALSGGGDSVALLWLLRELSEAGDLHLAGACHVHHHIRKADADADEQFCAALAKRAGVPLIVAHRDVPALAAASGRSLEVAGRLVRRGALVDAAHERAADRIATAHTQDDQAETVLLRMARGTGVSGLAGIAPLNDPFIRPVLDVSRQDLRGWLEARGEIWREDATNADVSNPRNRLRHRLLPDIRAHLNPSADRALARLADIARAEDEVLRSVAAEAAARVTSVESEGVGLSRLALATLPPGIARRVVRMALETANPARSYDLDEVDLVCDACASGSGGPVELRGVRVERNRPDVVLLIKPLSVSPPPASYRYELSIPGSVSLPEAGWVVEAEGPMAATALPGVGFVASKQSVTVAADLCGRQLLVRSRAPGDRMRLAGVNGRTKLQDLFVNRKVSRQDRDRTPIVTNPAGAIVWVGGVAVADEFRVSDATKAVVVLKLRRLDRREAP